MKTLSFLLLLPLFLNFNGCERDEPEPDPICTAMTTWSNDLPTDGFRPDSAKIEGDCLNLWVHYSGGCKDHEFFLTSLPTMGIIPVLSVHHNANGDMCEAYIADQVSFDLSSLQNPAGNSIIFNLVLGFDGSDYNKQFTYYY